MSPILLCTLLAAAPGERVLVDQIAAVVNDDVVTLSDVKAASQPYLEQNDTPKRRKLLYRDILEQLVNEKLLSQQIEDAQIDVSEDEVERAMQDIVRQNQISLEQLQQAVEQRGMSMGQYKEDLKSQLIRLKLVDMKVRSRVVIPEADIKAAFERRFGDAEKEEMLAIRHLFFRWGESPDPDERARVTERARAARQRIEGGEPFAEVAKAVSEGPTAAQGGGLGELSKKGLLPELARALEGVEVGTMTPPVPTTNGVHVVLLESRRFKDSVAYADERDKIYQELYQKRVEEQMQVWLDELRDNSAVDIRLD